LFQLTQAGVDKWIQTDNNSYIQAGSPQAGHIASLYELRTGPFEFPASLQNNSLYGIVASLELVGLTPEQNQQYVNTIFQTVKNEQTIATPIQVQNEINLNSSDFVYNSINELQGSDPFNLLKQHPNIDNALLCDMNEFGDNGGDLVGAIISKKSYKDYELSFTIKYTQTAKYRNPFNKQQKISGIFFGYPYDTTNSKVKGYVGQGAHQIESGNPQNFQQLGIMSAVFAPGLEKIYIATNPEIQAIFLNILNNPDIDHEINYKIIHTDTFVKIFINNIPVQFALNGLDILQAYILQQDPPEPQNVVDVLDIGIDHGSFGFQTESCSFEVTNLTIKPA